MHAEHIATHNRYTQLLQGRVMFYSQASDVETQKRGWVNIIYMSDKVSPKVGNFPGMVTMRNMLSQSLPCRVASLHLFLQNSAFVPIIQFVVTIASRDSKVRMKIHDGMLVALTRHGFAFKLGHSLTLRNDFLTLSKGSPFEFTYALMTFGIHQNSLPLTEQGDLKLKNNLDWIKRRKQAENYAKAGIFAVVLPSRFDILVGKGKPNQWHTGNIRLHNLVDELLSDYEDCNKREREEMVDGILQTIRLKSGRFLSCETGVWMEVPAEDAQEKVSQLFRSRKKVKKSSTFSSKCSKPVIDRQESRWITKLKNF